MQKDLVGRNLIDKGMCKTGFAEDDAPKSCFSFNCWKTKRVIVGTKRFLCWR